MSNTAAPHNAPKPEHPHPGKPLLLLGLLLRIWRRLENIAFGLLVLLIALYLILQSSYVQNWLIQKISGYLSQELNTTVSVGHVDIAFFDNLALEQVYIQDLHGDTLLYAGQLTAGLKNNIFSVFDNSLEFNEITLANARCHLRRYEGEYDYNYQFLIDFFSGNKPKQNKTKAPFKVKIKNLRLDDVMVIRHSDVSGEKMTFHLPKGQIQINNFDANSNIADIELVDLTGFHFDLEQHIGKKMPPKNQPKSTSEKKPVIPFQFIINHLRLNGGRFDMDRFSASPTREMPDNVVDLNHIAVSSIGIDADNIRFNSNWNFEGKLNHFAATEQSGFAITHIASNSLVINDTLTALCGTTIQLPGSTLGDTILFQYSKYGDFKHFNNDVSFDIRLKPGSSIQLNDLAPFKKSLAESSFLEKNANLSVEIAGQIKGKVNRLDGRNIVAKIGNSTFLDFDFDGEDLARGADMIRMELDFRRAQTDIAALQKLIPGFKPPSSFTKLGNVRFTGTYNLLFGYNHILNGRIHSDIGYGELDMKLDLTEGKNKAQYSGKLNMHNFDLKTWTGNKDFGNTAFNLKIADGSSGLSLSSINAKVNGQVDSFFYKGYTYRSLALDGLFKEALFEGKASISDPNIRFVFDGTVNMKDTTPVYLFAADIQRIDLKKLNLSKEDLVVSANVQDVRLTGKSISDLSGVATIYDILIDQKINADSTIHHRIDSIRFESNFLADNFRHFALRSELLTAEVDGQYNLGKAPGNLLRLLSRYYPVLAAQLKLPATDSSEITDAYRFGVYIKTTNDLTKLIDRKLDTIANVSIGGQVNAQYGFTEMYATIPQIRYGSTLIKKTVFNWRSELGKATMVFEAPETQLSAKKRLPPIRFVGNLDNDQVHFDLFSKDANAYIKSVNLKGTLSVVDSLWQVRFNASQFDLFNLEWAIQPDNYVRFGKNYIETRNFELMNGLHRIILDSQNEGKGIKLTCSNFDMSFINELIPAHGLKYRGNISDFDIIVEDVFKMKNAHIFLATDTVFINKQPYGRIDGNIELKSLNEPLEWSIACRDEHFHLSTTGAWLFSGKQQQTSDYVPDPLQPGDFYSKIEGDSFPMSIVQQFVPGISNTAGRFNLDAILDGHIKGKDHKIGLDGKVFIHEGEFKINYLNVPFYIKKQKVILSDNQIWADGTPNAAGIRYDTIYDATKKNMALVKGGLRHDFFRKWKIECEVASIGNNFLLMDTKKSDNPIYYGKGVGSFRANFGGTFSKTDIEIFATTGANTRLFIPLTSETEAKAINFINFSPLAPISPTPSNTLVKRFNPSDLKGMNIKTTLTMTEQAEVQLIFDEKAGDILKGKGGGTIAIDINRNGDFLMNGNYSIYEGEYLFTLLNFVNKPFNVKRGGTIAWYGDPYGAQIDLQASYPESTPLYNLIRDELAIAGTNSALIAEANKSTPVEVTMHLTEDLFKPTIAFDLAFPNVNSQIKSFVDNKLRLLAQDPNEINRQVFGLILFGSFLPPDQFTPQTIGEAFSTLTQFMGSQFSNYLSSFVSEWFGGSVSSIDFDIIYKESSIDLTNAASATSGRDLQVRMRSGFANDRITIQVGSQFGIARPGIQTTDGFLGEDVVIEIQPLENRQWRIKAYQRTEPDISGSGFRARYGIGLSFRRDFNSFDELMTGLSGWISSIRKPS